MKGRRVTEAIVATLLALVLGGALLPVGAGARPRDDLPVESRLPVDGTRIADATAGVAVQFTCPPYHQTSYDDAIDSRASGYHVLLARAGELGLDGLLLASNRVDTAPAVEVESKPGMCTAAPDEADRALLPTEPGTYWWQAYRDCATYLCASGVEVGDAWSFTVAKTVCTVNRGALAAARRDLAAARAALRRKRTDGRRARVTRLDARVAQLRSRLRVVYHCAS